MLGYLLEILRKLCAFIKFLDHAVSFKDNHVHDAMLKDDLKFSFFGYHKLPTGYW